MSELTFRFVEQTDQALPRPEPWPALVVPRAAIEREIERLADIDRPADGRRASSIVHPCATEPGMGLSPGTDVTINVLKPGEETTLIRHTANQLEFCVSGRGVTEVSGESTASGKWDVSTIPPMQAYRHRNDGDELWIRLTYSNRPLLEKLGVLYAEADPPVTRRTSPAGAVRAADQSAALDIELTPEGARMRSYEYLVDIDVVEQRALRWPWEMMKANLPFEPGSNNRGIMLLYNPATERRNGTTPSYFCTISGGLRSKPPPPVARGHRHISTAINYYFLGNGGRSIVEGRVIDWGEGDLMLSAPGWAEHAHYMGSLDGTPVPMATITVQDHPMHIALGSLIWQEDVTGEVRALGSEPGEKNYIGPRRKVVAA